MIEDSGHSNPPTTTYTYDPWGDMLTQKDANLNSTTYAIDNLGRTTSVTDANGHVEKTFYSPAGEIIGTYNARTQQNSNSACNPPTGGHETVCYTLDRVGRTVGVSYLRADALTQISRSFGYNADEQHNRNVNECASQRHLQSVAERGDVASDEAVSIDATDDSSKRELSRARGLHIIAV